MKKGYGLYSFGYIVLRTILGLFYRLEFRGRENIIHGSTLICASHSKMKDPFLIAFAYTRKHYIRLMAKAELFKIPILSWLLWRVGTISVDRGISDLSAIRTTLKYLKSGVKVAMFPEGTRVSSDDAVSAKRGAIWLAERAGVPITPLYIPRKLKIFRKNVIVIGAPYQIGRSAEKRSNDEYQQLASELMLKIKTLKPGV